MSFCTKRGQPIKPIFWFGNFVDIDRGPTNADVGRKSVLEGRGKVQPLSVVMGNAVGDAYIRVSEFRGT